VISITDGQIFLEPKLFYAGVRPAINVGISVPASAVTLRSRRCARWPARSSSSFRSTAIWRRSPSSAPSSTPTPSARWPAARALVKTLNQSERHPIPVEVQVTQIYAATNGYLDRIAVEKVEKFLDELGESVRGNEPS